MRGPDVGFDQGEGHELADCTMQRSIKRRGTQDALRLGELVVGGVGVEFAQEAPGDVNGRQAGGDPGGPERVGRVGGGGPVDLRQCAGCDGACDHDRQLMCVVSH